MNKIFSPNVNITKTYLHTQACLYLTNFSILLNAKFYKKL